MTLKRGKGEEEKIEVHSRDRGPLIECLDSVGQVEWPWGWRIRFGKGNKERGDGKRFLYQVGSHMETSREE